MGLLRWFFRVIIVLFLIRMAVMLVRGLLTGGQKSREARRPGRPAERLGGRLVRDPQCGTHVPQDKAVAHGRGDAATFFCSTTCRDAWLAAGQQQASRS